MEKNTSASIKKYSHLSLREREEIAIGLENGLKQHEIASILNRNPGTISREIKRNKSYIRGVRYRASRAQFQTEERKKNSRKKMRIPNKRLRRFIRRSRYGLIPRGCANKLATSAVRGSIIEG